MTQEEFLDLYPDSDDAVLGEEMGMTVGQVWALAGRLNVRKSKMHRSVRKRRRRVLGAMRGDHVWEDERKELENLAVCLENYDRINGICDRYFGRKQSHRNTEKEFAESDLIRRMEDCYKRMSSCDLFSDEAKEINEEIKDLSLRLHTLREKAHTRKSPISQTDYIFLMEE